MPFWAPLALTGTAATLLGLPVLPALYELKKRRDAGPLPTSRHDGRIGNFAETFQARLEPLRAQLDLCCDKREIKRTSIDGMEVLLAGMEDFDFDSSLMQGVAAIMCGQSGMVPAGRVVDADIYANGTLRVEANAAVRAARATENIMLAQGSTVLRWLHCEACVYLCAGSTAYGRLSAGQSIYLERGAGFERMHAPQIFTVEPGQDSSTPQRSFFWEDPNGHEATRDIADDSAPAARRRVFVKGDFVLRAGETLRGNVIATGKLLVETGAHLFGSAKSYRDTTIEDDACIHGSLVCGGSVRLGARSQISGPVMAEDEVLMATGTSIGRIDSPTTVSSRIAIVASQCQLYGTVWARERGIVGD
ncbi:MAG: hypothetical protein ACRD4E_06045 [Bryobacteraceae bacterium]